MIRRIINHILSIASDDRVLDVTEMPGLNGPRRIMIVTEDAQYLVTVQKVG